MKKALSVIMVSSLLVACGSSSNGNPTANTGAGSNAGSNPTTPSQSASVAVIQPIKNIAKDTINKFTVSGQTIDLIPSNMQVSDFMSLEQNLNGTPVDFKRWVGGTKYTNSRFGIVESKDKKMLVFSHGVATVVNDLPQTNGVEYKGDVALYNKATKKVIHQQLDATVNFVNHSLIIDGLSGEIKGNKFTFENKKTNGRGQGQFYGPQAAELGGTYEADNLSAAFGAKKQ